MTKLIKSSLESKLLAKRFKQKVDCKIFKNKAFFELFKKHTPFSISYTILIFQSYIINKDSVKDQEVSILYLSHIMESCLLIHLKLNDWKDGNKRCIQQLIDQMLNSDLDFYNCIDDLVLGINEKEACIDGKYFTILSDLKKTFLKIFIQEHQLNVKV